MNEPEKIAGDAQLVKLSLEGDKDAFGALVERHWCLVRAIALARLGDPHSADDVAQESFIRAWTHLLTLRDHNRFRGWVCRIAQQRASDYLRRKSRGVRKMETFPEDIDAVLVSPEADPGLSAGKIRFVREALGRLPEKFREVVTLRFLVGLNAVEIAKALGRRPGTVRVQLHRAYRKLKEELAGLLEEVD